MMGIPPEQAGRLSPGQYNACLREWNRRHSTDQAPPGKPMSIERMRELGIDGV